MPAMFIEAGGHGLLPGSTGTERYEQQALYLYSDAAKEADMLALRLPPEIERRLEELARRTGRSKSFYARQAILEHLEDLEDTYLAEDALEEHYSSGARTLSMEEILERYG